MSWENKLTLEKILLCAGTAWASDVHLCDGSDIIFRIHGELKHSDPTILSSSDMEELFLEAVWNNPVKIEAFKKTRDLDFAYTSQLDGTSYRVNAYSKMGKIWLAIRRIEKNAKSMDDLGLPDWLDKVLIAKQGIFLITGPTGSGKSTTMVSIIERINQTREEHIITIEDPIEFVFENKRSMFSQREVGRDTLSFVSAIRSAMREDPDIVMVWEMRDHETVEAAMNLAETWHLVFSTLHTSWSVQTISRIVQFFPSDIQEQTRVRLADSLIGVLSQRLIPRVDIPGRVWIHELMYVTPAIKNLIKSWDLKQINNNIVLGFQDGMIHMRKSADRLRDQWVIQEIDYEWYFMNEDSE